MATAPQLILASSSPYRKALLQRFGLPFTAISPAIDEQALADESPRQQVLRLAEAKARKIAGSRPDALIIGSDQAALLEDRVLTKPGNRANAIRQLGRMRNRMVVFKTGLCLLNARSGTVQKACVDYRVYFRDLTDGEIERYVDAEQPYDCAGSFKSEQLGIALVAKMSGNDPTALIGLPLVRLAAMLRKEGLTIP